MAGIRDLATLLVPLLVLQCAVAPRPAFKPIDIAHDEAVRAWLEDGEPVGTVHSFVDDQVDITIVIRDRDPNLIACVVSVDNRSPDDVILNFEATTIADASGRTWTLSGPAFSVERNSGSPEWRIAPGETDVLESSFTHDGPDREPPAIFTVTLEGFIGPLRLSDRFEFDRIRWP